MPASGVALYGQVCKDADGHLTDNEPGRRISGNSGFGFEPRKPQEGVALTCRARRRLRQAGHDEGTVRSPDFRMGRGFVISETTACDFHP